MGRFRIAAGIVAFIACILLILFMRVKEPHLTAVGGTVTNTKWTYELQNRSEKAGTLLLWSLKDGQIVQLSTHQIPGGESRSVVIQEIPGAVKVSCGAWNGSIKLYNENFYPGWTSSANIPPQDGGMHALWHGHSEEVKGEWRESLTYHRDGLNAFRESSRRQPNVTLYGLCLSFDEANIPVAKDTKNAVNKHRIEDMQITNEP